jgi:hypothetical protein
MALLRVAPTASQNSEEFAYNDKKLVYDLANLCFQIDCSQRDFEFGSEILYSYVQ